MFTKDADRGLLHGRNYFCLRHSIAIAIVIDMPNTAVRGDAVATLPPKTLPKRHIHRFQFIGDVRVCVDCDALSECAECGTARSEEDSRSLLGRDLCGPCFARLEAEYSRDVASDALADLREGSLL